MGLFVPVKASNVFICGALLIERNGYQIQENLIDDYRCPQCNAEIAGFGL